MSLSVLIRAIGRTGGLVVSLTLLSALPGLSASNLQTFRDVKLVSDVSNDGDSFVVELDGKPQRVRLYFVDCPETTVEATSDAQRVREQARYFGLGDPKQVVQLGQAAKKFTAQALNKPFQVDTTFATAGGRSKAGRVYAFITTADGKDLAELLVQNGLARVHGVGRETADGTSRDEHFQHLRDLEAAAMMKRVGIWAESNPDRIAETRATQRKEDQELVDVKKQAEGIPTATGVVDINKATKEELETLPGIGPALAERIIAARPFRSVDDLRKVSGIGSKKFEQLRSRITVNPE